MEPQNPLEVPVETNETAIGENDVSDPIDVNQTLVMESVQAHQTLMTESKGNIQHTNNLLRSVTIKKFDQVGSIEASSVEKVLTAGK